MSMLRVLLLSLFLLLVNAGGGGAGKGKQQGWARKGDAGGKGMQGGKGNQNGWASVQTASAQTNTTQAGSWLAIPVWFPCPEPLC